MGIAASIAAQHRRGNEKHQCGNKSEMHLTSGGKFRPPHASGIDFEREGRIERGVV